MSFREQGAWGMLVVTALTGAFWAWEVIIPWIRFGEAPEPSIKLVIVYLGLVLISAVFIFALLAGTSSEEAEQPADEREARILEKSGYWSGMFVTLTIFVALFQYLVDRNGDALFQILFGGYILSQICEYAARIVLFRRGV